MRIQKRELPEDQLNGDEETKKPQSTEDQIEETPLQHYRYRTLQFRPTRKRRRWWLHHKSQPVTNLTWVPKLSSETNAIGATCNRRRCSKASEWTYRVLVK